MYTLALNKSEKYGKQVYACAISRDGTNFAAGCHSGDIFLHNASGKHCLKNCRFAVNSCIFTSTQLIAGSTDEGIYFWDYETLELQYTLNIHKGPVRCLYLSKDESILVSGSGDNKINITRLREGSDPKFERLLNMNESDAGMISGICLSHDNSVVVVSSTSGNIFLYDIMSPKPRNIIYNAHEMGANCCDIAILNSSHIICTAGADYAARIWELNLEVYEYSNLFALKGHTGQILCCRFTTISPSSKLILITGSIDKTVILWDVANNTKINQVACHTAFVYSIAVAGNALVTGSSDKTAKCWSISSSNVKLVNVTPALSHHTDLPDWTNRQVQSWLHHIVPNSTTSYTGHDLKDMETEDLVTGILGKGAAYGDRLRRSITLLKTFNGIPTEFLCPISMEIMVDPVVTSDGHSYERSNISEWLAAGHHTSPLTNTTLTSSSLITNHNLRKLIQTAFFTVARTSSPRNA